MPDSDLRYLENNFIINQFLKKMKIRKSISLLLLMAVMPSFLFAGGEKKKTETVTVQTSAQCGSCKARIEAAVSGVSGVKTVTLNLDDKKATVTYSPKKTSASEIKTAISKAGYDADEVAADPVSYANLPTCCQKGGHD